jgi:hypothetical protein
MDLFIILIIRSCFAYGSKHAQGRLELRLILSGILHCILEQSPKYILGSMLLCPLGGSSSLPLWLVPKNTSDHTLFQSPAVADTAMIVWPLFSRTPSKTNLCFHLAAMVKSSPSLLFAPSSALICSLLSPTRLPSLYLPTGPTAPTYLVTASFHKAVSSETSLCASNVQSSPAPSARALANSEAALQIPTRSCCLNWQRRSNGNFVASVIVWSKGKVAVTT